MAVTKLTVAPGGPSSFPAIVAPDGSTRTADSFGDYGIDESTVGSAFDPAALYNSARAIELGYRASYFACTQHDGKQYRWDGTLGGDKQSMRTTPPMMGSAAPSGFIPLSVRRPSAPYRLARKMVSSFTGMLFGQGRWPQMRSKDPETQAAAEQLSTEGEFPSRFIQARNYAGPSGTAGVSWQFVEGKPRVNVHRGSNIHPLFWVDRESRVLAHVIELKRVEQFAPDPEDDNKLKPMAFWQRRDWTLQADVVFKLVPVYSDTPPSWVIDEEQSTIHNDGECHFVWVANLPPEDDTEDGACDYAETYEQQDELDILNSVATNGVKLNLDPTVVLSLSEDQQQPGVIRKGSDNAIVLLKGGTASYMQLQDTTAGREAINQQRQQILEVCECVVADPDKAAAAAASGEAQRMLYAPMLNKTDTLRMQWGPAIALLTNQMLRSWRRLRETPVQVEVEPANDIEVIDATDGSPLELEPEYEEAAQDLVLQPRVMRRPNAETGKEEEYEIPHEPGDGEVTVEWGAYFKPSGTEKQAIITAIGTATGGKPILSQRTGTELASNLFDRDATEEVEAVQAEAEQARSQMVSEFSGTPGEDDNAPVVEASGGDLAPTDKIKAMTANEVRAKMGLGPMVMPDGSRDPDGEMKWVAYLTKLEAQGEVEGQAQGEENAGVIAPDDDLPIPAPQLLPSLGE